MPATNTAQNAALAALAALLATMTAAQKAALLDVLGMHIENVETSDETDDGNTEALETEGHVFLVAMHDAAAVSLMGAAA